MRIPTSLDEELRTIARERNTSVNALAESVLQKFVDFDRHTEELDYAVVPKSFLAKLVTYLSKEQATSLGEWSAKGPSSDAVHFYEKNVSLAAVLNTFEGIGSRYSRLFAFHHEVDGREHTITLNHGMGMKWSIFYDANLKKLFTEMLGVKIRTELTENLVTGHFEVPPSMEYRMTNGQRKVARTP
jgi:hypothetical protein